MRSPSMPGSLTRPRNCVRRAARDGHDRTAADKYFRRYARSRAHGGRALIAAGRAGRHRSIACSSRAAARSSAWRHGDQCRHGARQGCRQEAARACRSHRGKAARRRIWSRRSMWPARALSISRSSPRPGSKHCGARCARPAIMAAATSAPACRSTSNMSRPIRPARCMSAIAAARCSATRSRVCSTSPASR